MKANEFVKKHGLAEVKILLTSPSHGFFFKEDFYKHYGFDIYEDLKRLVESHELVERVISRHNKSSKECQIDINGLKSFVKKNPKIYSKRLKQAIADVESCQ